jgi:histidyl-tRNA synthetase
MPRRKKIEEPIEQVKKIKAPAMAKGMKDILPSEQRYWKAVCDTFRGLANDFSFVMVDTPIFERSELYTHTLGRQHPLVKSDGIVFLDKSEKLTMRADYTPGLARSFVQHNLSNQTPPNKYWYSGKIFSQGKHFEGKNREMHQIGFEVYNAPSHAVDAELVFLACHGFENLGLKPQVRVNSVGCLSCRNEYLKALSLYIKSRRSAVCSDCRSHAAKDPYAFLACTNQKCQKQLEDAPQVVDYLCETCHDHLFKFLESLDDVKIDYVIDQKVIPEFAYYNSTVYEIYSKSDDKDIPTMLMATGGRQNYLAEMLSGPATPSASIKFLVENVINTIKESKIDLPKGFAPQVYLAQLSEQAKREAMRFVGELRAADLRVVTNFSKDALRSQLEVAQKLGVKIILIIGQREVVDGTILMRDVDSGIQEVVNIKKVVQEVKRKLALS